MSKKILLVNDLAGYGKVALSAMIPVLSHMGPFLQQQMQEELNWKIWQKDE